MSTIIARNEVLDCSNPKLDIFTVSGPTRVDVFSLEFIIFDIAIPAAPVQTFPVAGRATVDLTACPGGDRLGVGHYHAEWTVDALEPLTPHKISWFIKLLGTSPEVISEQPFDVVSVVGVTDPADVEAFRLRFPDFADQTQFPASLITLVLNEATVDLDPTCFGTLLIEQAKQYYAAHLLAYVTGGARAKGASSVSAGSASISWDTAKMDFNATAYGQRYVFMARMCTGATVVC